MNTLTLRQWGNYYGIVDSLNPRYHRLLEVIVTHEFNLTVLDYNKWVSWTSFGTHKNVIKWVILQNDYAVGFNENPRTGWSFPVHKLTPDQVKEYTDILTEGRIPPVIIFESPVTERYVKRYDIGYLDPKNNSIKVNGTYFDLDSRWVLIRKDTIVIKNEANWIPTMYDSWGRGVGEGVVLEIIDVDTIDVRWPTGRCYESPKELLIKK